MAQPNPQQVRSEVAKDLRDLADLLRTRLSPICSNVTPIYEAAEDCLARKSENLFEYNLPKINFRVSIFKKSIPSNLKDITVSLWLSVKGYCAPAIIDGCQDVFNPLKHLQFNIVLNGRYISETQEKTAYSSWHLDRDEEEGRENQEYLHPFYHFQYGGRMLERDLDYGSSLIVDTPRIPHPPMDAILGIDFVLTNFVKHAKIKDLREDAIYKRIVKNSQSRIWKPYIMTLARAWGIETTPEWCAKILFPQIMK